MLFGRLRLAAGSLLPAAEDDDGEASFCRIFLRSRAFQKFLISLSDLPGSLAAIWDQLIHHQISTQSTTTAGLVGLL